jgi:hypothetical protein
MAKTKSYDPVLVIEAIDKYFFIENYGDPNELKMTKICRYLTANGFPDVNDRKLNRDSIVREHVENLKTTDLNNSNNVFLSYTPLIAEDFIKTNNSVEQLNKALTILDNHYEKIYQFATAKVKEANEVSKTTDEYSAKLDELITENDKNILKIKELNKKNHILEAEIKRLRNYIKEIMLPELANEILREERILFNGPKMITDNGFEEMVIDDTKSIETIFKDIEKKETRFKNNLIAGLFESLESDN